jgi:carbonic anhydrase
MIFPSFILIILIKIVNNYDFNSPSCQDTSIQQSPINIVSSQSLYFDEKYFRFLTNNYDNLIAGLAWSIFPEEMAVGFQPKNKTNFGSFIFVKDWAMYNFYLKKILFRVGSEHQIDGNNFDVEMQLVHVLDTNYLPPGRRVSLNQNYLTISLFFKITDDDYKSRTRLFEFMDLKSFSNGNSTGLPRDIKLRYIIQHQPSFLYEGTLTYPECQQSLWLVFSQFHLISKTDYSQLSKVINEKIKSQSSGNTRSLQQGTKTAVYRNWNDLSRMKPNHSLMIYNISTRIHLSYKTILGFLYIMICLI